MPRAPEFPTNARRPEYRYRYQLPEAQALIRESGLPSAPAGATAADPTDPTEPAAGTVEPTQSIFHGPIHRTPLGHAVSTTASACVGATCTVGGSDAETGCDGAGLVKYAYLKQGINLPPLPQQQFAVGATDACAAPRRGDAVFFGRSADDIQNVGIYVGGGTVITAAAEKSAVSIDSLNSATSHSLGARRYSDKLLTGAEGDVRTLPTIKSAP